MYSSRVQSGAPVRNVVPPSCVTCRSRKVRCDKKSPCTPCTRGGRSCSYRPLERRHRRERKTTINDVAVRLSELEKTLSEAAKKDEQTQKNCASLASKPAQHSGHVPQRNRQFTHSETLLNEDSSTHYVSDVLVSRVVPHVRHVGQTITKSPDDTTTRSLSSGLTNRGLPSALSPFNPMGILSSVQHTKDAECFHPPAATATRLWKLYADSIDSCVNIVHLPTAEASVFKTLDDPSRAPKECLALCYAIYYAALVAMGHDTTSFGWNEDDRLHYLRQCKLGLESALAHADFLQSPTVASLQALAIYLTALRGQNSGRATWILNGLGVRAAQSIGLHRYGKHLGLSPFDSEIRRRLWWTFAIRDRRAVEDHGFSFTEELTSLSGIDLPRNLDDSDLSPTMTMLPQPKTGWTRMTMTIVNIEISKTQDELQQLIRCSEVPRHSARDSLISDLEGKLDAHLKDCNSLIPSHRMTIWTARFLLRKLDFVSRQQWLALNHQGEQDELATDASLDEALDVLAQVERLLSDPLLEPFRWSVRSYPQYHLLIFILWHACARPVGPSTCRAVSKVEDYLDMVEVRGEGQVRGTKWKILQSLRNKAASILEVQANQQNMDYRTIGEGTLDPASWQWDSIGWADDLSLTNYQLPYWDGFLHELI